MVAVGVLDNWAKDLYSIRLLFDFVFAYKYGALLLE